VWWVQSWYYCNIGSSQGRDEAVAQEGAQNSVKKGSPFWDLSKVSVHASHETLTLHSPVAHPALTLLARCECLKRHGVGEREGELGADFSSVYAPTSVDLPRVSGWHIAVFCLHGMEEAKKITPNLD
jgi:hypothetical protein